MLSFYDAHAAVGVLREDIASTVEYVTYETGRRPFPHVAAEILQAVFVDAEGTERSSAGGGRSPVRLALVASDPALGRVVFVDDNAVVLKPAAGGERPFFVSRKPVGLAGLAR